jgi:hypothetical protein
VRDLSRGFSFSRDWVFAAALAHPEYRRLAVVVRALVAQLRRSSGKPTGQLIGIASSAISAT